MKGDIGRVDTRTLIKAPAAEVRLRLRECGAGAGSCCRFPVAPRLAIVCPSPEKSTRNASQLTLQQQSPEVYSS
ncbi:hypothetical protein M3J09_011815 [Ascochyta lentis]